MAPGQLLLVGVPGRELDAATAAEFRRIQPGGYILFGRNIAEPGQLRRLVDDLRDLSRVEPVITIDQEGGRVSRLRQIGNEPPNAVQLRDRGEAGLIRRHGEITARLLRLFGFNLDLCPVLDISFDDLADNSLKGRCYGRSAAEVVANTRLFNEALRSGGVASCGKHFPGYSRAGLDPHHGLPRIELPREGLEAHELAVFRAMAGEVDSMMVGHAVYPALDGSGMASSLSAPIVSGLLRGELGFGGLVMTDDIDMGALVNHYGFDETVRMALEAGNDLVMICHRVDMAARAAGVLARARGAALERALASVAAFKAKLAPPLAWDEGVFREVDAEVWRLRVEALGEEKAAERSAEDGKRSPVELY